MDDNIIYGLIYRNFDITLLLDYLEKQNNPIIISSQNEGLFDLAIFEEKYEIVKTLIDANININNCDGFFGQPPLLTSASRCNYNITKLLLINGAEPNIMENNNTSLIMACLKASEKLEPQNIYPNDINNCLNVIDILLDAGADPFNIDKNNKNLFDIYEINNSIKKHIKEYIELVQRKKMLIFMRGTLNNKSYLNNLDIYDNIYKINNYVLNKYNPKLQQKEWIKLYKPGGL